VPKVTRMDMLTAVLWTGVVVSASLFFVSLRRALIRANLTDWGTPWLNLLDGLNRLFCRYYHDLQTNPLPIPSDGPAVVVANHVSGLDPLVLIAASRRPLRFLIAREQYRRPGLTWLFKAVGCIPVDRQGRPDRALREALRRLRKGEVVAVFPYGRIQLPRDVGISLRPGALLLARRSLAPLIAVRIDGVSGAGKVVLAIFFRSRVSLQAWELFCLPELSNSDIESRLDSMLRGPDCA